MQSEILEKLLEFISHNFMIEPEEIDLEDSLIDQGIIDSFGLIEISAFLEKEFSTKITEDDMTRENFGSTMKIVQFVKERMAG